METTLKSLLLKPKFNMMIVHRFSRNDFSPKSNVDIVLLHIQKRKLDEFTMREFELYRDFICYCYKIIEPFQKDFSYRQLKELRIRHGISNYQTSAIAYEEWIILFKCFYSMSVTKKKQVIGSYRQYLIQESLLKSNLEEENRLVT